MKKSTPKTDVGGTSNREVMKTPKTPKPKPAPKPLTLAADDVQLPLGGTCRDMGPEDAIAAGYHSLIYQVTVSYPSGNFREQVYVGSKSLKGNQWRTYTTSSETVRPLIERAQVHGGVVISWSILGYARNHKQAIAVEASYITLRRKEYGSRLLNKVQANGSKLGTVPNKYSKRKVKIQPSIRYT